MNNPVNPKMNNPVNPKIPKIVFGMNNPVNPKIPKIVFGQYIKQFNFRELFNEMGWNNDRTKHPVVVETITYQLEAVAEKSGFKILILQAAAIPDYATRKKIETQVTKLFHEHLIIFTDMAKTEQIWQLAVRQAGKPTKLTETRWNNAQTPELLYQRAAGVFFEMDEEEHITIIDVTRRMAENFQQNNERVTKVFYYRFKEEHTSFLQFITGITERTNREWYASLMLNRLMFCYFIQKRGFLDNNKNYLRDKLNECKRKQGNGKFYSFYRSFLLVLFHKGFNNPAQTEDVQVEIGKIPYLNGGLFDEHEIEKSHSGIDIDDKAFENLFAFFDRYEWHLDTRNTASGKDINPDVIGYIFEKYINDRADMGAYYTKEDITDYISKNCIIPCLLSKTRFGGLKNGQDCKDNPVNQENPFNRIPTSADRYIYDAVKKGVELPLPEEIEVGLDTTLPNLRERRKEWNKPAAAEYALPTEIWRETVARRRRYTEVRAKIDTGEIQTINDFITYNLNIRQFAQDAIENTNDPEFLKTFYNALATVTILDPTCGSGAFLFAAMNILEPLYEACIMRMRAFVEDEDRINTENKKNFSHKYKFFREMLENIQSHQHPNLSYFIYKSIILNNLYGVDIKKEAVEIAKLRLFLKLVATVEPDYRKPNLGLEPLPDIDFNVRAGNTLVGFATEAELTKSLIETIDGTSVKSAIEEKCEIVAMAFQRYKDRQLKGQSEDYADFKTAKDELNNRLQTLNHELNLLLHKQASGIPYADWLASHQPFHWFAEFYEIVKEKGGFDVIIGNPPYVEYGNKLKSIYQIKGYETVECGNLHAFVAERTLKSLLSSNGYLGLIIPLPAINTSRMETLQTLIKPKAEIGRNVWISAFDERPSSLFDGVDQRLIIEIISKKTGNPFLCTTGIKRWNSDIREFVFPNISYSKQTKNNLIYTKSILKIKNDRIETSILRKFYMNKPIAFLKSEHPTGNVLFYRTAGGRYWKVITNQSSGTQTVSEKTAYFNSINTFQAIAIISSSLFWWYYSCHFDMFNLKDYMIFGFRFSDFNDDILSKLSKIGDEYSKSLESNSEIKIINSKTKGTVEQKQYVVAKSKPLIDAIDVVLAEHYGFTEEELDFIINYDIKYRMGSELNESEE